jgi:hypothetical protein
MTDQKSTYGIGPETSAGNGVYKMETTTLGAKLTYDPRPTIGGNLFFNYKNVNITNGEDGGRGIIDDIFERFYSWFADELLVYGAEVATTPAIKENFRLRAV